MACVSGCLPQATLRFPLGFPGLGPGPLGPRASSTRSAPRFRLGSSVVVVSVSVVSAVAAALVGSALVVAGGSKLAARESWPVQARGLGAPVWTIPIVPWFELVLGALLVVQIGRPVTALAAIGLFVVFTGLIAAQLRRGHHPPCACFGSWSASPIGPRHVVRNVVLIALAIVAML